MNKTFRTGWFLTITGREFHLLRPDESMISLIDICHSLSLINRFNGHIHKPYSVAEHLCRCYQMAPEDVKLEVLIHDFAEAYYHDIMSPLKDILGSSYKKYENRCQELINKCLLGYKTFRYKSVIKQIDYRMLCTEARDHGQKNRKWWRDEDCYPDQLPQAEQHWTVWRTRLLEYLRQSLIDNDTYLKYLRPKETTVETCS